MELRMELRMELLVVQKRRSKGIVGCVFGSNK